MFFNKSWPLDQIKIRKNVQKKEQFPQVKFFKNNFIHAVIKFKKKKKEKKLYIY